MRYRINKRFGISLVEILMASSVVILGIAFSLKTVSYLQDASAIQNRLRSKASAYILVDDIAKSIRQAKSIRKIGPGYLELETYNFSDFSIFDRELHESRGLISYSYENNDGTPKVVKKVFSSTASVQSKNQISYLRNLSFLKPSKVNPIFYPTFVIGNSTRAVRINIESKKTQKIPSVVLATQEVFIHSTSKKPTVFGYKPVSPQENKQEEVPDDQKDGDL